MSWTVFSYFCFNDDMDPELPQTQPDLTSPSVPLPTSKSLKKLPLLLLLCGGFLILLIVGSYFLGTQNNTPKPTLTLSPTTAQTTIPSPPTDETTLNYTTVGDTVYLQYREKIYGEDKNLSPQELSPDAVPNAQWDFILQAKKDVHYFDNEVFSFQPIPASPAFLFIMRWVTSSKPKSVDSQYAVYLFNPENTIKQLTKLNLAPSTQASYDVAKISSISTDGKYASFHMFSCWNCGGHMPETVLLNLQTGQSKRIGKVYSFAWQTNGSYTYKAYIEKPCPTLKPDEVRWSSVCTDDEATLPLKTGQF